MLIDARLKSDELRAKLIQAFDDPDKMGFFLDDNGSVPDFSNMCDTRNARAYASVNSVGEIIGFITYAYDPMPRRCYGIGAINFTNDKLTFAADLLTLFRRMFLQRNVLTIEFRAITDNPACEQYERFIKRVNGKLVGVLHDMVMTSDGQLHDMNIYEIRRKDYLDKNNIDVRNTKSSSSTRAHSRPKSDIDTNKYVRTSKMHAHQLCETIERERDRFITYRDKNTPVPKLPETGWGYISDEYVYIEGYRFERVLNASGIGTSNAMKSRVLNTLTDAGIFCAESRHSQTCTIHVTEIGDPYSLSKTVYKFKRGPEFDAFVKSVD